MSTLNRVVPIRGLDSQRLIAEAAGKLLAGELYIVTNKKRLFLSAEDLSSIFVGPSMFLGAVDSEAAMLALTSTNASGCFPGDTCFRADTNSEWVMQSGSGELLAEWYDRGSGGAEDVISGGDFLLMPTGITSGGSFLSRPTGRLYGGSFVTTLYGGSL